ncbi:MAG: response regulator [Patescibacteria group bacterium]
MTKIMLVEDDNNLREIYEARLLAEGYEIVSAKDGEEALAMAVKEKPDLIISDVMMPKISGFDMLDILRSTPETKNTKVIMMTALSQAEDKARADKLGADRYLVKSQVTLEDVARVAKEVITGEETPVEPTSSAPTSTPSVDSTTNDLPLATPVADAAQVAAPPATIAVTAADDKKPADSPNPTPEPPQSSSATVADTPTTSATTSTSIDPALALTSADESATIDAQIDDFVANAPSNEPPASPEVEQAPKDVTQDSSEVSGDISLPLAPPVEEIAVKDAPVVSDDNTQGGKSEELADAVGKIVNEEPENQAQPDTNSDDQKNVPIAHKKVIEPLDDMTQKGPDLQTLLAKEDQKVALSPVVGIGAPPVQSVVKPGGETITPAGANDTTNPHQPGNVIQPGSGEPSDFAL